MVEQLLNGLAWPSLLFSDIETKFLAPFCGSTHYRPSVWTLHPTLRAYIVSLYLEARNQRIGIWSTPSPTRTIEPLAPRFWRKLLGSLSLSNRYSGFCRSVQNNDAQPCIWGQCFAEWTTTSSNIPECQHECTSIEDLYGHTCVVRAAVPNSHTHTHTHTHTHARKIRFYIPPPLHTLLRLLPCT